MTEKVKKRKTMRRPVQGIAITVWSQNGTAIPEDVIQKLEYAVNSVILTEFNEGHRLLTQTTKA